MKSAQNSASFDTLCAQFGRNYLSTLIRDGAVFLKVKSSNDIETVQYFKKTILRISRPNQNQMKQSDLGKSLDPYVELSQHEMYVHVDLAQGLVLMTP